MQTQISRAVSVTIPNPTAAQMIMISELMDAADQNETTATPKRAKRSKPEPTVSDEEDEDFATKAMDEEDITHDEPESEDEDDAPSVTFQEVKAAINKYGEKHPDQMRAILAGFNMKGPKELAATKNEKYWEPVFRKVMSKLKASKK